jgi:hypothetical protein
MNRTTSKFESFLSENDIDLEYYISQLSVDIPRYFRYFTVLFTSRIHPDFTDYDVALIEKELNCTIENIPYLSDFYSFPSHVKISQCSQYKQGIIFPMDVTSGVAVSLLDVQPKDDVLDLWYFKYHFLMFKLCTWCKVIVYWTIAKEWNRICYRCRYFKA